jgi:membrane-bound lytic murein transglycosylase D
MRRLLNVIGPVLVLPACCFAMLSYPVLNQKIKTKQPVLSIYYISRQLNSEVVAARSREPREIPANYGRIIQDYRGVLAGKEFGPLKPISGKVVTTSPAETLIARAILWREELPSDFLQKDPAKDIIDQLNSLRDSERRNAAERESILTRHALDCLRYYPPDSGGIIAMKRGLPPEVLEKGLFFCGEKVPLERTDVRRRIEYQIAYLLADFRDTTGIWLKRKDRYGDATKRILEKERVPGEFALLPALESGYSHKVVSPSMAGGWWQFVRPTAVQSLSRDRDLNWSLQVDSWKDERRDLALSTRSAARYLKWMRSKLGDGSGPGSWLTAAAAYNAGFTEVKYRTGAYGTTSYWDMKLPAETEEYIPRWIALSLVDGNRRLYGIELPLVNPICFDTLEGVQLVRDLPLSQLAVLTESSVRFIREINAAVEKRETCFRAVRNNTPLTHTLHVPKGWGEQTLKTLKSKMYLRD